MKNYLIYTLFVVLTLCSSTYVYAYSYFSPIPYIENDKDRKLSKEEVKERGLDILANQTIENIDKIDLRKMARSSIFETTYGFRWKMFNLKTGNIIIIKVDKNFKLISARNSSFDS